MEGRVLLIENDSVSRAQVTSALADAGFSVAQATDGGEGMHIACQGSTDVVIMAEDVPSACVEEMCFRLRRVTQVLIIVIGNKHGPGAGVTMLELGADAYMSKPPHPGELVARVRSLLRRRMQRASRRNGTRA